jgi:dephospho-CoA kinase
MLKIAITGNIAAGKSVIERMLTELHYPVIDTDKIVHNLYKNSEEINRKLRETFGNFNICTDHLIDRKKLSHVVFSNKKARTKLENIVYPHIIDEILKFFEQNSNEKFVFVSVPLLYEANWNYLFDKVIMVAADDNIRLHRLITERHLSKDDALRRMNAQLSQKEKIRFADFVLYNNSNYISIHSQINEILSKLL